MAGDPKRTRWLHDYQRMAKDGFAWWQRRVRAAASLYDMVRIDHFRGFARYWSVPAGEKTAKNGHWVDGPGVELINALRRGCPGIELVAEDLGTPTPDVMELLLASGLPGMKVLQFAFDGREDNEHLPHGIPTNCVCYTGTHDNAPLGGWFAEESKECIDLARRYASLASSNPTAFLVIAYVPGVLLSRGPATLSVMPRPSVESHVRTAPSSSMLRMTRQGRP